MTGSIVRLLFVTQTCQPLQAGLHKGLHKVLQRKATPTLV